MGFFFNPVLMLWSTAAILVVMYGGELLYNVRLDLVRSFGAICEHYGYHMCDNHLCVCYKVHAGKAAHACLVDLLKNIRRYNNSALYVTPRWPLQWILPLNFLEPSLNFHDNCPKNVHMTYFLSTPDWFTLI